MPFVVRFRVRAFGSVSNQFLLLRGLNLEKPIRWAEIPTKLRAVMYSLGKLCFRSPLSKGSSSFAPPQRLSSLPFPHCQRPPASRTCMCLHHSCGPQPLRPASLLWPGLTAFSPDPITSQADLLRTEITRSYGSLASQWLPTACRRKPISFHSLLVSCQLGTTTWDYFSFCA